MGSWPLALPGSRGRISCLSLEWFDRVVSSEVSTVLKQDDLRGLSQVPFTHLSHSFINCRKLLPGCPLTLPYQIMFSKLPLCAALHTQGWKPAGVQILSPFYFWTVRELAHLPWGTVELRLNPEVHTQVTLPSRLNEQPQVTTHALKSHTETDSESLQSLLINGLPLLFLFLLSVKYKRPCNKWKWYWVGNPGILSCNLRFY